MARGWQPASGEPAVSERGIVGSGCLRAPGGGFAGYSDGDLRWESAGKRATPRTCRRRIRRVTRPLKQLGLDRVVEKGPFEILRPLIADLVEFGKPPVREGVALVGAALEPAHRLGTIDPSPDAVPKEAALIGKCWGIPAFSGLPVKKQSLRIIFGDLDGASV